MTGRVAEEATLVSKRVLEAAGYMIAKKCKRLLIAVFFVSLLISQFACCRGPETNVARDWCQARRKRFSTRSDRR